ncbi:hypothetical protein ACJIZ3_011665 [Penstemon smallii]|uniref:CW-type domain-containing protein n=1 Tax=Penstemon smallii TaxID=265156 RepID=A0ABD3UP36_9LAMI
MISVRSRDGRKDLGLGLGVEMEDAELEEGEALRYQDEDGDSTIDPDIALSYIGEKLQNVLGHFQKDFEGGVSAENLGAKFGGYGSFLPSHQRSPSWSHTRTPEVHNCDSPRSPRKLHTEDRRQNSLASSSASPSARPHATSGKTSLMAKTDVSLPSRHAEEFSMKRGDVKKSVNSSDQRTLKVRIKVGTENLSTQKNAEIYSGLGLVISPSSSLDDSPKASEGLFGEQLDAPEKSPTSILQIMTSLPTGQLLSPLSEDLINLIERRKLRVKSESKPFDKTSTEKSRVLVNGSHSSRSNQKVPGQKKLKSSERDDAFSKDLTNDRNNGDQDNTGSLLQKEKETDIDTLGCEELVSNALKLPLLSSSQSTVADPKNGTPTAMHRESAQDIGRVEKLGRRMGSSGKVSESKRGNLVNGVPAYAQLDVLKAAKYHASEQSESNVFKGNKALTSEPTDQLVADSSVTRKNVKSSHANGLWSKTDSHDLKKDHEKPGRDRYTELFGAAEDDNESMSGEMNNMGRLNSDPQLVGKRNLSEHHSTPKEKCNVKNSEKSRPPEKYPRVDSHVAPHHGNRPSSEAPMGTIQKDKEDWVLCEKCTKWRLLPLDIDPESLPKKWVCRMLSWLPGMNRCNIPEDVTNNAIRALYPPAALVPAPTSEIQHNQLNNSILNSVGVSSVDARYPGQEHQNIDIRTATINGKKKHESTNAANSTDLDGSTHSKSRKKNISASGKESSHVEMHNDNVKDKKVPAAYGSDKDLKIRSKRESDLDGSRVSKRIKSEELLDDQHWSSDNGEAFSKAGRGSTNPSRNARRKHTNHDDSRADTKKNIMAGMNSEMHVSNTSDGSLLHSIKSDDKDCVRKRKGSEIHKEPPSSSGRHHQDSGDLMEEMSENDHRKEKKARLSKSGAKETSGSKASLEPDKQSRGAKEQHYTQYPSNAQPADYLKSDKNSVQHSVAANSSSSKVSGSRKNKTSTQEVKGSPVESVSSSPIRFPNFNGDKFSSTRRISGGEDDRGIDRTGIIKRDPDLAVNDHDTDVYRDQLHQSNQYASEKRSSDQCQVEENIEPDQYQNSASHSKKSEGLTSHSKNRDGASGSDLDKHKTKGTDFSHDSLNHVHSYEEKSKSRRNKSDEKNGSSGKADRFIAKKEAAGGTLIESKSQDKKQNFQQEHGIEKLPKKSDQTEVYGSTKSHSLPPLAKVQTETDPGSQKQKVVKVLAVNGFDNGDSLKAPNQSKKAENLNGQPITSRHPTPNSHKVRDVEAPSPMRKDSSNYAANSALKEAKDLKHLADRLKNSGSADSIGFYFQSMLKFLHGAFLLETGRSEGIKHNEIMHSMHIYGDTAKLLEYYAHEYEKSKDMAAAALAHKCAEVAYMRVVYFSNTSASRDRIELQTALQIVPPGESPSSSASDVDNLNHPENTDKAALGKVVDSPQVSGSHIITSRSRAGLLKLLNFTQDVNHAMEASRKSRMALTAATSKLGDKEISSLKKALDFDFQDVEGFLRLVRVAMEAISL